MSTKAMGIFLLLLVLLAVPQAAPDITSNVAIVGPSAPLENALLGTITWGYAAPGILAVNGLSLAQGLSQDCERRGGFCSHKSCPPGIGRIGLCSKEVFCCRRSMGNIISFPAQASEKMVNSR
ncbi:hypothetical protein CIB84_003101 [Bambusicola thoracicus]|uniref:Beta-defensin-like domain-containing protein n=1 Tax=Bambusicola thoracicus TaxID=9083 RepID=A0A2P4T9W8_BAMTH|nr:hypothetical protein CIB84_003101 [Bambusicola thoracicus]